ncbi:MAG: GerW family sporulation protein [Oscillospiraceae bacterium]|jgi:sporulation protein YtfJ|nr:GerW family sporulation protein [Oscillospiraceae bacterium]
MKDQSQLADLMEATMRKIREMVDVNTIVGTPIKTDDGVTLIPISKVTFGFTAGGAEFASKNGQMTTSPNFGGGSGAGVSITPVAFLVVNGDNAKVLTVDPPSGSGIDRAFEALPDIIEKIKEIVSKKNDKNKDVTDD